MEMKQSTESFIYRSPDGRISLFLGESDKSLGIAIGGHVIVKPFEKWHEAVNRQPLFEEMVVVLLFVHGVLCQREPLEKARGEAFTKIEDLLRRCKEVNK